MTTIKPLTTTAAATTPWRKTLASTHNPIAEGLFSAADRLLGANEAAQAALASRLKKTANPVLRTVYGTLAWGARQVLDHDYSKLAGLPRLGNVVAQTPIGAFLIMSYGFMIGGRVKHAMARAKAGDTRERTDILVRDIPTIFMMIFLLEPLAKLMSAGLQRWKGIQLLEQPHELAQSGWGKALRNILSSEPLSYEAISDAYTVINANRLKEMMANPLNHKGMKRAVNLLLGNKNLSQNARHELNALRYHLHVGIEAVQQNLAATHLDEAANKAYGIISRLEQQHLTDGKALGRLGTAGKGVIGRISGVFRNEVPEFTKVFAQYAKNARSVSDIISTGLVIGLLGFGVTWWNQRRNEKQYEMLKQARLATKKNTLAQQASFPTASAGRTVRLDAPQAAPFAPTAFAYHAASRVAPNPFQRR